MCTGLSYSCICLELFLFLNWKCFFLSLIFFRIVYLLPTCMPLTIWWYSYRIVYLLPTYMPLTIWWYSYQQVKWCGIWKFLQRDWAKLFFSSAILSFSIKLVLLLIYLGEICPMQSSEFIKSLYFGSNKKKILKIVIFF